MCSARKRGRPSTYTEEAAIAICGRLMAGRSLRSICRDEDMPSIETVCNWLARGEGDFLQRYARAREIQAEVLADETQDIADDGRNDWMEANDPSNPGYRLNGEHVQRSRLRIDQRKWYASKVAPKKYGERLELAGEVGVKKLAADMTDEELAAIAAGKARGPKS